MSLCLSHTGGTALLLLCLFVCLFVRTYDLDILPLNYYAHVIKESHRTHLRISSERSIPLPLNYYAHVITESHRPTCGSPASAASPRKERLANLLRIRCLFMESQSPTCASPAGATSSKKARLANLSSKARRCPQLPKPRYPKANRQPLGLSTSTRTSFQGSQ